MPAGVRKTTSPLPMLFLDVGRGALDDASPVLMTPGDGHTDALSLCGPMRPSQTASDGQPSINTAEAKEG